MSRTWSAACYDANLTMLLKNDTADCGVTLPLRGGKIANVFDQSVTVAVPREQKPLLRGGKRSVDLRSVRRVKAAWKMTNVLILIVYR